MRYALKLLVGLGVSVGAFAEPCLIGPGGDVGAQANEPYQHATPWRYLVAWEGDDWPENEGWRRNWGNWQGQYQGPGAYRTLENGILTYDSLYDPGVCDYNFMYRPGQLDPEPGEVFVMEWRLRVDQVTGGPYPYDPDVTLRSDEAWGLSLLYGVDQVWSIFEDVTVPFAPGVFHAYRVVSPDMRNYDLYIDGRLARSGTFVPLQVYSKVGWGDGVQGRASLHSWDYFRFGVLRSPEPAAVWSLAVVACCARRRG